MSTALQDACVPLVSCSNCKRLVNHLLKSRCTACFSYLKRKGVERPKDVPFRAPTIPMKFFSCETCGNTHTRRNSKYCPDCGKQGAASYTYAPLPEGAKRKRIEQCINCGLKREGAKRQFAKDRCWTCYNYHKRNGFDRPPEGFVVMKPEACSHCGFPHPQDRYVKGLCVSCSEHKRRVGVLPDERAIEKRRMKLTLGFVGGKCSNCDYERKTPEMPRLSKGLCLTCYEYRRRRGTDRPVGEDKQTEAKRACANCGLHANIRGQGRCGSCFRYLKKHGTDVSPELRKKRSYTWHHSRNAVKQEPMKKPTFTHCRSCDVPKENARKQHLVRGWCERCYQLARNKGFDKKGNPFNDSHEVNPVAEILKREVDSKRISLSAVARALTQDYLGLLKELEIVSAPLVPEQQSV